MDIKNETETGISPEGPQHVSDQTLKRAHGQHTSKLALLIVGVLVLLIVFASVLVAATAVNKSVDTAGTQALNTNEYQALFLTNGQVYFGRLSNLSGKYVTLTDIYYLQVQAGQTQSQSLQQTNGDSSAKVSLAKLGNELHGPEDKMEVASDQVLFWENLKPTSKVVEAINKYQNQ